MIHIEYAVPYWWNYGLFETVPFYIGIAWDGCGVLLLGDYYEKDYTTCNPMTISEKLDALGEVITDQCDDKLKLLDERLRILEKQIIVVAKTFETIAKMLAE